MAQMQCLKMPQILIPVLCHSEIFVLCWVRWRIIDPKIWCVFLILLLLLLLNWMISIYLLLFELSLNVLWLRQTVTLWPWLGSAELMVVCVCFQTVMSCGVGLRLTPTRWIVQTQGPQCALCGQELKKQQLSFIFIFLPFKHFSCNIETKLWKPIGSY